MRVDRVLGLRVASPIRLGSSAGEPGGSCDVRFALEAAAPPSELAPAATVEIRTVDDAPYLLMGRIPGGFLLRFPGWADFVVGHDASAITCTPVPGIPVETLRHLLLGQVLPRAMALRRNPALHGSAVGRHDGAVAFLGPTGHGKSTLALSLGRSGWTFLADDCLLLRESNAGVEVVPSGVGARVWPDSGGNLLPGKPLLPTVAHYTDKRTVDEGVAGLVIGERPVPLRRLYLLDGQEDPTAKPAVGAVAQQQAFEALLQHVMRLPPSDPERLRREFEFLTRLVNQVVVRRLRFPWAFEQLAAVRETIEADLGQTS